MPRLKHHTPSYRRHNRSGRAVVSLDGKDDKERGGAKPPTEG